MKKLPLTAVLLCLFVTISTNIYANDCSSNLDFTVETLTGNKSLKLCEEYQGDVILVVNTASKCGFTGQYEGLEKLYSDYKDQGLVVLGFPSNDFGNQEPGSSEDIAKFCRATFGVKFPMFAKTSVKPGSASPFYQRLIAETGVFPKWNFHKYLIDREGNIVASFDSLITPESDQLMSAVKSLL